MAELKRAELSNVYQYVDRLRYKVIALVTIVDSSEKLCAIMQQS